jgi:hypothetical protein
VAGTIAATRRGVRWQRYWFASGGRIAVAILRIAIAVAVMWALHRLQTRWPSTAPGGGAHSSYRAVGVWMVVGDREPADAVIAALWLVARISTVAMLLGAWSRIATALSFLAFVALASLSYSGAATWSHPFNPILLAQLAFLGARGGDTLSVDALVRRLRGKPPLDVPHGYQWSIRLVQLAVALVFASAVFHKMLGAGFTLRWVTTDNLRNQILLRYDLGGWTQHPPIVDWLLDKVWRFRTAAALSMISQALPILACVFVTRPVLRAICGAAFVVETVALGVVMQYWNLEWLPLAVVFVDWDALARVRPPEAPAGWRPRRATKIFVIAFVVYEVAMAFVPQIDQWLNTYPFTGYPLFAALRVRAPYDEHLPYALPAGDLEVLSDPPIDTTQLDAQYRETYKTRTRDALRARLIGILADIRRRFPAAKVSALRIWVVILETPAYPAHAQFVPHRLGVLAELRVDGTFTSKLDAPLVPRTYFRADTVEPYLLPVEGWAYAVANEDVPWIVARR